MRLSIVLTLLVTIGCAGRPSVSVAEETTYINPNLPPPINAADVEYLRDRNRSLEAQVQALESELSVTNQVEAPCPAPAPFPECPACPDVSGPIAQTQALQYENASLQSALTEREQYVLNLEGQIERMRSGRRYKRSRLEADLESAQHEIHQNHQTLREARSKLQRSRQRIKALQVDNDQQKQMLRRRKERIKALKTENKRLSRTRGHDGRLRDEIHAAQARIQACEADLAQARAPRPNRGRRELRECQAQVTDLQGRLDRHSDRHSDHRQRQQKLQQQNKRLQAELKALEKRFATECNQRPVLAPGHAQMQRRAQQADELERELNRLRTQVERLKANRKKTGKCSAKTAALKTRIDTLTQQVKQAKARAEQAEQKLQRRGANQQRGATQKRELKSLRQKLRQTEQALSSLQQKSETQHREQKSLRRRVKEAEQASSGQRTQQRTINQLKKSLKAKDMAIAALQKQTDQGDRTQQRRIKKLRKERDTLQQDFDELERTLKTCQSRLK